ncbi:RNA helicase [Pseudoloma neurophilia]|uniref:ATP-dependent RNA helicase n=1 Tax=Pseudoloma neurophilia TaxID=146866 RepID=A0A0R0M7V0_9MICR|nr:RNA helicase [Pseudoloma neurophilia]
MSRAFDDFRQEVRRKAIEIEEKYKKLKREKEQKTTARLNVSKPGLTENEFLTRQYKLPDSLRKNHKIEIINHLNSFDVSNLVIIEHFTDLKLSLSDYNKLRYFNIVKATPIQMQVIPLFLQGFNVYGQSQTGTGKTLCFVLPLIILKKFDKVAGALILLPTRELCIQVEQFFSKFLPVYGIYGGSVNFLKKDVEKQIIVATPGRLLQILQKNNHIANFSHLILDEFDKMTSKEFIKNINEIVTMMNSPQICVLSATYAEECARLSGLKFDFEVFIEDRQKICQSVEQKVYFCTDKFEALIKILRPDTIIFTNTKDQADELVVSLQNFYKNQHTKFDYKIESLHSGKDQVDRNEILENFHNKNVDILICTGLMSRGIDFKIDRIINYELPNTVQDLIHQIGRTGRLRFGTVSNGVAFTLLSEGDRQKLKPFEDFWDKNGIKTEEFDTL